MARKPLAICLINPPDPAYWRMLAVQTWVVYVWQYQTWSSQAYMVPLVVIWTLQRSGWQIDVHGAGGKFRFLSPTPPRSVKTLAEGFTKNIMPGCFHHCLSVDAPESGFIANSISVAHWMLPQCVHAALDGTFCYYNTLYFIPWWYIGCTLYFLSWCYTVVICSKMNRPKKKMGWMNNPFFAL